MILRGPNLEKFMLEIVMQQWISIWDLTVPQIKKLKKLPPIFLKKEWGSVFFNFLIRGTIRSQIAIHHPTTVSCVNFSRFGPLKSIYLTELRAAAQIGLKIKARFNICKNLSSAQISLKSGELNLKLCYYANKQQLTKLSLV